MSRCKNVMDRGGKVHIPGCMGCAAMGHDRCTCPTGEMTPQERAEAVHSTLLDLEAWVRKLTAEPNHRKHHCKACHLLRRLDRLRRTSV